MKDRKAEKKEKRNNNISAFKNTLYLTSSKAVLVVFIALLTFLGSMQLLEIVELYTQEKSNVINVFKQGRFFDYENSEPFKQEARRTFAFVLDYALQYQDTEGFLNPDYIKIIIDSETENCQKQIKTVLEILEYETEHDCVSDEYIQNGFVSVDSSGGATINKTAVEEHYEKQYADLIESQKRTDDGYRETTDHLNDCRGLEFAVFDRENNRVVSNVPSITTSSLAEEYFSSSENSILLFNSKNPYYIHSTLGQLLPMIQELCDEYEQNFDFFVAFNDGLVYNSSCEKIESEYNEVLRVVARRLAVFLFSCLLGGFLIVVLLRVSGRREHHGAPKYALTDRLPNELHLFVHVVIILSMLFLNQSSLYLIMNPHLDTTWLTVIPDFFVIRAEICSVVMVLFVLAAVCCVKRHILHGTLFSNTLFFKLLSQKRKSE